MKRLSFLLLLAMLGFINLQAQNDVLESFNLTQSENSVVVNISIRGGASCNGITLQRRGFEDTEYTVAGEIQGVCGGSEFTEHYVIEDEMPMLGEENIYRLVLGSQGFSSEKSIVVIELIDNYNIYPQPASDQIFIAFDNPNQEVVSLSVYSMDGKAIIQGAQYDESLIYINGTAMKPGMYIFQLSFSTSKMITGRFIRANS